MCHWEISKELGEGVMQGFSSLLGAPIHPSTEIYILELSPAVAKQTYVHTINSQHRVSEPDRVVGCCGHSTLITLEGCLLFDLKDSGPWT